MNGPQHPLGPMAGDPPPIGFGPVSTSTGMVDAPDGTKRVVLRVAKPDAIGLTALDPNHALQLGHELTQMALQAGATGKPSQAGPPRLMTAVPAEAAQALRDLQRRNGN